MKWHRKNSMGMVLAVALSCIGLAAYGADDERVQAASQRIRQTLDKIGIPDQPAHVPDVRSQIHVPELEGVKHRVPEFQNYGATQSIDPMKIAQRYQSSVSQSVLNQTDVLVFVSFSMPESSLKRIAAETARIGGVMVIRGFKDGSLRKTIEASQELAALQGELLIHPELFDHYQITEVPTTVLAKTGDLSESSCQENQEMGLCTEHYQVKGDISLHAALEYFADLKKNPELSDIAMNKLTKLRGQ